MSIKVNSHMVTMPVLALRGIVVFPEMLVNFDVEREKSIRALEHAMETNQKIFLTAQREIGVQDPVEEELFGAGE